MKKLLHALAHMLHLNGCITAHREIGGHVHIVAVCATCGELCLILDHSVTCWCKQPDGIYRRAHEIGVNS